MEFKGNKDRYGIVSILGSGTYGIVFKVKSFNTGNLYALKLFTNPFNELNFNQEEIKRTGKSKFSDAYIETRMSLQLVKDDGECSSAVTCSVDDGVVSSQIIVQHLFYDIQEQVRKSWEGYFQRYRKYPNLAFLVQELMDGDIGYTLKIDKVKDMKNFMTQVLLGVEWLHMKGLAHNDIKQPNIFYKRQGSEMVFKLGDLGSACSSIERSSIDCKSFATPIYGSPTILRNFWKPITLYLAQKGDMWALGVVFYMVMKYQYTGDKNIYNLLPYDYNKFKEGIERSVDNVQGRLMSQKDIFIADFPFKRREEQADFQKINQLINGLLRVNDDERYDVFTSLNVLSNKAFTEDKTRWSKNQGGSDKKKHDEKELEEKRKHIMRDFYNIPVALRDNAIIFLRLTGKDRPELHELYYKGKFAFRSNFEMRAVDFMNQLTDNHLREIELYMFSYYGEAREIPKYTSPKKEQKEKTPSILSPTYNGPTILEYYGINTRKDYLQFARKYHPDRNPDQTKEEANTFKIVNAAYENSRWNPQLSKFTSSPNRR